MKEPIVISEFHKGIGDSPYTGFGEIVNLNISDNPGNCRITNEMIPVLENATTTTFIYGGAGVLICAASMLRNTNNSLVYRAVTFSTTGTLPTGLVAGTVYFLADYAGSATQVKVCASIADVNSQTYVNITAPGSGTHTITTVPFGVLSDAWQTIDGIIYAQDSNNRVWKYTNGFWLNITGNRTIGGGNSYKGIVAWKGYLFAWKVNVLDVMNISTGTWTSSWQSGEVASPSVFWSGS